MDFIFLFDDEMELDLSPKNRKCCITKITANLKYAVFGINQNDTALLQYRWKNQTNQIFLDNYHLNVLTVTSKP